MSERERDKVFVSFACIGSWALTAVVCKGSGVVVAKEKRAL